jgi:hypothetical protein
MESWQAGQKSRNTVVRRRRAEVKVHDAAKGVVFEVLPGLPVLVDLDVHPAEIEEEDAVGAIIAVFEVDQVVAVQVCTTRGADV